MKDFDIFSELLKAAKKDKDLENICMDCVPRDTAKPKTWIVKLCKKCGKYEYCH